MSQLAMHPRLAHMVLMGMELGHGALACEIAALLSERDIIKGERDADLHLRLQALRNASGIDGIDRGASTRVRKQAEQWRLQLGLGAQDTSHHDRRGRRGEGLP